MPLLQVKKTKNGKIIADSKKLIEEVLFSESFDCFEL